MAGAEVMNVPRPATLHGQGIHLFYFPTNPIILIIDHGANMI